MLKEPQQIRYFRINGADTYGQWVVRTSVRPETEMNEFHKDITNHTYVLKYTELLIYYGSHLSTWNDMTIDDLIYSERAFADVFKQSMYRYYKHELSIGPKFRLDVATIEEAAQ
jgi:hypothetical protein